MSELPMPTPTVPLRPFPSFKLISLDIYGTLIDWETGILTALKPLLTQIPSSSQYAHFKDTNIDTDASARSDLASLFNTLEAKTQKSHPGMRYADLLPLVYLDLASEFSIPSSQNLKDSSVEFGQSIGSWPAFPDTVDAMVRLQKYYRLVPLSNVDRDSFSKSRSGPLQGKIDFWRVFTAEDVGNYKPDLRNFRYLIENVDGEDRGEGGGGVEMRDILHVAQSLFHDHRPAREMGMR